IERGGITVRGVADVDVKYSRPHNRGRRGRHESRPDARAAADRGVVPDRKFKIVGRAAAAAEQVATAVGEPALIRQNSRRRVCRKRGRRRGIRHKYDDTQKYGARYVYK